MAIDVTCIEDLTELLILSVDKYTRMKLRTRGHSWLKKYWKQKNSNLYTKLKKNKQEFWKHGIFKRV